jgi:hypothetical protein
MNKLFDTCVLNPSQYYHNNASESYFHIPVVELIDVMSYE